MRWLPVTCLVFMICTHVEPVHAEDTILDVLHRSHSTRLQAMPLAQPDSGPARALQHSFAQLQGMGLVPAGVKLRVVSSGTLAEAMLGELLVVHESLGRLGDGERLFMLAHELGHLVQGHWQQMGQVYLKWIPGSVQQHLTDAVAAPLGRDASALAHQQELQADAFARWVLKQAGVPETAAFAALMAQGAQPTTATHPSTRLRLAALRMAGDYRPPSPVPDEVNASLGY